MSAKSINALLGEAAAAAKANNKGLAKKLVHTAVGRARVQPYQLKRAAKILESLKTTNQRRTP